MSDIDFAGIAVDGPRLWSSLMELAEIGSYVESTTGLQGVSRMTLTDDDVTARRLLMAWMADVGLEVRVDRIGNIFGRLEGEQPDLSPVMIGSHIDTVATAGAFDGCLGVLGGLEALRTLRGAGVVTRRPIELACFTEEEGGRFGTDMLGSAVASGRISLAHARSLCDETGTTIGDELERTGFAGPADERLLPPHVYLECHIEQGPILSRGGLDIGIVTGVQGISWQEITIQGRAAHAGATPTELRADAGLAAAGIVVQVRAMVESGEYGALRATVGRLTVQPNLVNIVPAQAQLTVDLRNPDDAAMRCAEDDLADFLSRLANPELDLRLSVRRLARTTSVPFDPGVQQAIASAATDRGLTSTSLLSGAGHDAQEIAAICPSGMLFVPGEYDGISHTPREYSTPDACERGVNVLLTSLARYAAS